MFFIKKISYLKIAWQVFFGFIYFVKNGYYIYRDLISFLALRHTDNILLKHKTFKKHFLEVSDLKM